ncbi:hypothetical protein H8356DRAFT_1350254 [Neocallimastix lanati (nom. inval.)]|nr:hypothetical protein H8356DRAFT_1350254 [Neocallimastix sp. JGI-2020a]
MSYFMLNHLNIISLPMSELVYLKGYSTGSDFTNKNGKWLSSFQNNTKDMKIELFQMTEKKNLEILNTNNVDTKLLNQNKDVTEKLEFLEID